MEYNHEKTIFKELENQRRIVFVQIVYPQGGEQIQRIQYQRLKAITNGFEETPFRVGTSISRGLNPVTFFLPF